MDSSDDKAEDLLADATALIERAQIELSVSNDQLVIGFRTNGALSIYLETEAAYHFNPRNELRRLFFSGVLYKAQEGRLVSLDRVEKSRAVRLQNVELQLEEQSRLLSEMNRTLVAMQTAFAAQQYCVLGQIPHQADIVSRLRKQIPQLLQNRIAHSAHVGP